MQHSQDGDRHRAAEVVANALSDQHLTPKQRLLRDELGFVAGVANIACAPSHCSLRCWPLTSHAVLKLLAG